MLSDREWSVDAVTFGRRLLGQRLVRIVDGIRRSGLIVETEAYVGVEDAASHAYGGRRTARNASMYLEGGHAYVYFTYGMHHCMNVVCGRKEEPAAVLIRALQPEEGIAEMAESRGEQFRALGSIAQIQKDPQKMPLLVRKLCNGPGKLAQALQIDRTLDGWMLKNQSKVRRRGGNSSPILWIEKKRDRALPGRLIAESPRIGLGQVGSWKKRKLRFSIIGHPCVSVPAAR